MGDVHPKNRNFDFFNRGTTSPASSARSWQNLRRKLAGKIQSFSQNWFFPAQVLHKVCAEPAFFAEPANFPRRFCIFMQKFFFILFFSWKFLADPAQELCRKKAEVLFSCITPAHLPKAYIFFTYPE